MYRVDAFALEYSKVAVVQVIQRCVRSETQFFELLGDCVSSIRDAVVWKVLDPCVDERQFRWVGFEPCR